MFYLPDPIVSNDRKKGKDILGRVNCRSTEPACTTWKAQQQLSWKSGSGKVAKALQCRNCWRSDFVPQTIGSPRSFQVIRDVYILLVSDFGISVEDGLRSSPRCHLGGSSNNLGEMMMAQIKAALVYTWEQLCWRKYS